MISEAELLRRLDVWRRDITGDPLPTLVDVDTALAVLAATAAHPDALTGGAIAVPDTGLVAP